MDPGVGGHGEAVSQPGHTGQCLGSAIDQEWGEDCFSERKCLCSEAGPAETGPRAGLRCSPAGRAGGGTEATGGEPG